MLRVARSGLPVSRVLFSPGGPAFGALLQQGRRAADAASSSDAASSPRVVEVTDLDTLAKLISPNQRMGVILDCYAKWCGPCRVLTPRLEAAVASAQHVVLAKLDVDRTVFQNVVNDLRVGDSGSFAACSAVSCPRRACTIAPRPAKGLGPPKLQVTAVPSLFVYHRGVILTSQRGLIPEDAIASMVQELDARGESQPLAPSKVEAGGRADRSTRAVAPHPLGFFASAAAAA